MKACVIHATGGLDQLVVTDVPRARDPGPGEVRVAVQAAALNHLDLFVVSGLPLFTKPLRVRVRLLRDALGLMRPGAPFIQFTYAVVPPIPKAMAGVHAEASERIWMNLPPARVWVYRKD